MLIVDYLEPHPVIVRKAELISLNSNASKAANQAVEDRWFHYGSIGEVNEEI